MGEAEVVAVIVNVVLVFVAVRDMVFVEDEDVTNLE